MIADTSCAPGWSYGEMISRYPLTRNRYKIVVIGVSQGGLDALGTVLSDLPEEFSIPIVIVQHRSPDSRKGLLESVLQRRSRLMVREPHDKEPLAEGTVYIAPSDYHLFFDADRFALSTDGPVLHARPSIDVMFKSAAENYRSAVIGVVLTGASADGADGARQIKSHGGYLIVENPETAECRVMPESAIRAAEPDQILDLTGIGQSLNVVAAATY